MEDLEGHWQDFSTLLSELGTLWGFELKRTLSDVLKCHLGFLLGEVSETSHHPSFSVFGIGDV